ncbi:MAG: transposase [Paracoccaceae bacterium]
MCQLLLTAPGVGPLIAFTFRTGADEVVRFRTARSVPAHFGLTPMRYNQASWIAGAVSPNAGRPGCDGHWFKPPARSCAKTRDAPFRRCGARRSQNAEDGCEHRLLSLSAWRG